MAKVKQIKLPVDNVDTLYDVTDAGAVRFDEATSLTDAQKAQARGNIGVTNIISIVNGVPNITYEEEEAE